mmetsp:Transcript_107723/g.292026  ORF Transcript_107723/g.292026 Transcript_107723/m.292026 type:complete len:274 (+) Transcript_107723:73-894(+)
MSTARVAPPRVTGTAAPGASWRGRPGGQPRRQARRQSRRHYVGHVPLLALHSLRDHLADHLRDGVLDESLAHVGGEELVDEPDLCFDVLNGHGDCLLPERLCHVDGDLHRLAARAGPPGRLATAQHAPSHLHHALRLRGQARGLGAVEPEFRQRALHALLCGQRGQLHVGAPHLHERLEAEGAQGEALEAELDVAPLLDLHGHYGHPDLRSRAQLQPDPGQLVLQRLQSERALDLTTAEKGAHHRGNCLKTSGYRCACGRGGGWASMALAQMA